MGRDYVNTVLMAVAQRENGAILQFRRAVTVLVGAAAKWAPVWGEAMEGTWSTATTG